MAQITYAELVELIKGAPQYRQRWESGVPAEQALYIEFTKSASAARSEVVQLATGAEMALDRDVNGRVVGIEFI